MNDSTAKLVATAQQGFSTRAIHGYRQTYANRVVTDAGEHLVGDEVGVEAIDHSGADAGKRKKQSVKLRLAA